MNKNIKIFINYFLGPALFIWLAWSIYQQISRQQNLEEAVIRIKASLASWQVIYLITTVTLMLVNWGLEAYKWKIAVSSVQQISFGRAFRAVLSGISFSVSTPNSIGDYIGRALYMDEGKRIKAVSLTVVANVSQLIITFLMGTVALFFLKNLLIDAGIVSRIFAHAFLWISIITLIILVLFYFRLPWLIKIIDKLPRMRKFSWAVSAVEHLSATLLVKFLSLSVLRYSVYSLQYYLLFKLFDADVSVVQSWMGTSVMFLVMAIIPTIALFTDVGIKNELSIQLMGLFTGNHLGVSLTTVSIWLINLVVPAMIGSLLLLGMKNIFKNRNENH